jgi:hypothetical protein
MLKLVVLHVVDRQDMPLLMQCPGVSEIVHEATVDDIPLMLILECDIFLRDDLLDCHLRRCNRVAAPLGDQCGVAYTQLIAGILCGADDLLDKILCVIELLVLVVWDARTSTNVEFDAKAAIAPGKSFDFKFTKLGTWKFHDHLSPSSTGSIIVSE